MAPQRSNTTPRWRTHSSLLVVGVWLLVWGMVVAGRAQITTEPVAARTTTATLRTKPDFFSIVLEERKTTLPTTSMISGESSATLGTVTVDLASTAPTAIAGGGIAVTTSTEVLERPRPEDGLPLAVDRSTTEAMLAQLYDLEKHYRYAEAFLLACQLVRENPDAEVAYDAAIRTAIVLSHANPDQMEPEIEFFFREGMRAAALPGRFALGLAHYYQQTGKVEKYRQWVTEYEKSHTKDPDYWVTLARIYAMSGDAQRTRQFLDRAFKEEQDVFPLVLLSARMYRQLGLVDKARETLVGAVDQNYGPWHMRSLLLELLKLPHFEPADVAQMVRAALANEPRYRVASGLAEAVIESAIEHRAFFAFEKFLLGKIADRKAADVEMWMAALMAKRQGEDERAFEILMSDPAKATPVIALERATALASRGRHAEARDIVAVLVAEQPNDVVLRLTLAREQLATSRPIEALDTLAPLEFEQLDSQDRSDYLETAMTAAVMSREPQRIVNLWLDLVRATTFAEVQSMGDIVVRALESDPQATLIETYVNDAARVADHWPLLALNARLCARRGDRRGEIAYYAAYLQHAADDTQMLRFAAQLALQYALAPLNVAARDNRSTSATIRVIDAAFAEYAVEFYRRLIALQPMVADNYASLMRVYQTRGEIEAAKKVAAELVARDPSSHELLAAAAKILHENGFLVDALHYYERALRADPSDYAVWLEYANALQDAKAYDRAATIYKKMIEEGYSGRPYNQPALLANLYKLATITRETTGLVEYLVGLRSASIPGKPEFLLSSAKLLLQLGVPGEALKSVEQFQREFPSSPLAEESHLLTGQIWYTTGDIAKAIAAFRNVQTKFPKSPSAVTAGFNIAVACATAGQLQEALATYRRLAQDYPQDDRALGALYEAAVLAYRGMKNPQQTRQLLEEFLATNCQDFALRKNARRALQALSAGKDPFAGIQAEDPKH